MNPPLPHHAQPARPDRPYGLTCPVRGHLSWLSFGEPHDEHHGAGLPLGETGTTGALLGWTREVGPGLLEWLARQTGRDLVAAEPGEDAVVPDLLPAIAEHSGALVAHLVKARMSSALEPSERDEIRAQIQKLIHELQLEVEYFDSPAERLRGRA